MPIIHNAANEIKTNQSYQATKPAGRRSTFPFTIFPRMAYCCPCVARFCLANSRDCLSSLPNAAVTSSCELGRVDRVMVLLMTREPSEVRTELPAWEEVRRAMRSAAFSSLAASKD